MSVITSGFVVGRNLDSDRIQTRLRLDLDTNLGLNNFLTV
jgi:hypothetical protein